MGGRAVCARKRATPVLPHTHLDRADKEAGHIKARQVQQRQREKHIPHAELLAGRAGHRKRRKRGQRRDGELERHICGADAGHARGVAHLLASVVEGEKGVEGLGVKAFEGLWAPSQHTRVRRTARASTQGKRGEVDCAPKLHQLLAKRLLPA